MAKIKNDLTISVIIPTYNRAHLVGRTIQSVLNQTYKNFEIIIVDDGSSDNTEQAVKSFGDKRIEYLQFEENSGSSAAPRNTAIKIAKGKYIAFLDSDDEWLPEKLERQIELFEKSNNFKLGFVGCDVLILDIQGNRKYEYKTPKYKNVLRRLLMNNFIWSSSSVMVKKNIFREVGLFDENLAAVDWDMWIRISKKYDFDFVREPLVKYYIHKGNISSTIGLQKKEKDIKYIFEKYKKYYKADFKLYSTKLRYDGTRYILAKQLEKGRKCFLLSIGLNPLNLKSYFYLLLSFGGTNFYYNLTLVKAKLKNFKIFHGRQKN